MNRGRRVGFSIAFALLVLSFPFVSVAGTSITLTVDAVDSPRNLLHSHETITVSPGPLTLFYPKWIPGEHGPTGPLMDLVGLKISAGGSSLEWRRDLVEMYAIHTDVPPGTSSLDVSFDYVLPPLMKGFSSASSSSPSLLVLSWNQVILYPEQEPPDSITVAATLIIRPDWKIATALEVKRRELNRLDFRTVPLTTLIDSPVQTGLFINTIDISGGTGVPHHLNIMSDDASATVMPPWLVERYSRLVTQANLLFGVHHYNHYDFLYTLSDQVAHFGLEHHQSSDDRVGERTLLDSNMLKASAGLLAHEFVHSWNGKYRRPVGLATRDYSTPMKDDLLWVYEGLTQYLGNLLTARSGLWNTREYREHLAMLAAALDHRPGRTWRPLQDAADEAPILYNSRDDWASYRRGTDFYDEGLLIWLEADVLIRQQSGGKKSLDDFCKYFYGPANTGPQVKPYTFEDVVSALTQIVAYDWKSFFTTRLQSLNPHAPLGGIENGGWRVVYRDTMSAFMKADEEARGLTDMRYSLGLLIGKGGEVMDVIPGSPAGVGGLVPMMHVVAVNGRKYTRERLREAVRKAKESTSPTELLTEQGEYYATCKIDYHLGEKYPFLDRLPSKPDVLDDILHPRTQR